MTSQIGSSVGDRAVLVVWVHNLVQTCSSGEGVQRGAGLLVTNPDSGNLRRHPAVGIAETAAAQLRAYAAELGLSPAAERRIGTFAPELDGGTNPFAG